MALLRQAVGEWSPRPHVIKYIVKEGDINDVKAVQEQVSIFFWLCQDVPADLVRTAVAISMPDATLLQDSRNNKKRKADALNGYTSSQRCPQAAAAGAAQQEEQPECPSAPRFDHPGWSSCSLLTNNPLSHTADACIACFTCICQPTCCICGVRICSDLEAARLHVAQIVGSIVGPHLNMSVVKCVPVLLHV